jgi:arginyl-tRNA synthetase
LQALGEGGAGEEDAAVFARDNDVQYRGEYLVPTGEALAQMHGTALAGTLPGAWLDTVRGFAVDAMMALVKEDLDRLGIRFDVFTSELALAESGAIDAVVEELQAADLVYTGVLEPPKGKLPDDWEARPQTLFRATAFGDDSDRPLKKSDGSWTYFASDIAYHLDKYRRGFAAMIDVWGTDHKGYVKRMQAAVRAVSKDQARLEVRLCNLVNLMSGGEPVKMSKRAGTFVTLREVVDEVGADAVRFIMLTRNNEAALDFDLVKVTEQSRDNPVFYVQYAHARVCSLLRNAAEAFPDMALDDGSLAEADLDRLGDPAELAMIKLLAGWPRLVESAAEAKEPHRIAFFLTDFAASFHGFWTRGNENESLRFIVQEDAALTRARIALARAAAVVIASGLAVMGVEPVEEMR